MVIGDFNGDGRDDVYLQPDSSSVLSRILYATPAGRFTTIGDSWAEGHLQFAWSQSDSVVHAGDFNGDGRDDLWVQAKKDWAMIPLAQLVIPIASFQAGAHGIVYTHSNGQISHSVNSDFWDSDHLNLDGSPQAYLVWMWRSSS